MTHFRILVGLTVFAYVCLVLDLLEGANGLDLWSTVVSLPLTAIMAWSKRP